MYATGRASLFLSREAVHLHREIVAKRRRGVALGAPLSARPGESAVHRQTVVSFPLDEEKMFFF